MIKHLKITWAEKAKDELIRKLRKAFVRLSSFPESNQQIGEMEGIYKCLISTQTSLFYRIKDGDIEVITLFDNIQDPKSIFEEVKSLFRL